MESVIDESIEWKDRENATITVVEKKNLKDGNRELGTMESKTVVNTTYKDLAAGLEVVKERLETNKKKVLDTQAKIEALGKLSPISSEMARIKKAIETLQKNTQILALKKQLEVPGEQIKVDEKMLVSRGQMFESRPAEDK